MAIKFSPKQLFIGAFIIVFAIYFIIGFQPAEATIDYPVTATVEIPDIGLSSNVASLKLENNELHTPDFIVGSFQRKNKTLLIGHSSTIFQNLHKISENSKIFYNGKTYQVKSRTIIDKNFIDMTDLLFSADDSPETLVLMTCIGQKLNNNSSTHRLIIYAEQING